MKAKNIEQSIWNNMNKTDKADWPRLDLDKIEKEYDERMEKHMPTDPRTVAGVIRRTSYGNYSVTQYANGDFVVTRFGQYVTTAGSERSALNAINRLIP